MDLLPYLDAARDFARTGGDLSLRWFRREELEIEHKADDSPVTAADRAVEQAIRRSILRRFPDHAVVGEEYGGALGQQRFEWIIDPIDGTKSFVRGVPLYTTLVALLVDGTPQVGVVYCPATGEMASAAHGMGAWDELNRPLRVSGVTELSKAWLGTTDPSDFLRREGGWAENLLRQAEASRTWADAYGYLLVARGDMDLMIDPIMSPWDIAPLPVIIREAGGVFFDIAGGQPALGSSAVAAASPALAENALELRPRR